MPVHDSGERRHCETAVSTTFIMRLKRYLCVWLEDEALSKDEAFAALARGFARFIIFLSAEKFEAEAIHEPLWRQTYLHMLHNNLGVSRGGGVFKLLLNGL